MADCCKKQFAKQIMDNVCLFVLTLSKQRVLGTEHFY